MYWIDHTQTSHGHHIWFVLIDSSSSSSSRQNKGQKCPEFQSEKQKKQTCYVQFYLLNSFDVSYTESLKTKIKKKW